MASKETKLTRKQLIALLNEDLEREYQAIIAYVVYSQVLKGAEYMSIADELAVHAGEELQHALILSNQIDYLGKSLALHWWSVVEANLGHDPPSPNVQKSIY